MNLLLKVGLAIERKNENREKEKRQFVKGEHLDNFAAMYGLRRRHLESDTKLRKRIFRTASRRMTKY